jgi:molecular chaperone HtpG
LPESYNIIINHDHPVIKKIIGDKKEKVGDELSVIAGKISEIRSKVEAEKKDSKDNDAKSPMELELESLTQARKDKMKSFANENQLVRQVCDLALLANGMLKGENLDKFVKRSLELIK